MWTHASVVEWSITTDCKSVAFELRWFKSNPTHHMDTKSKKYIRAFYFFISILLIGFFILFFYKSYTKPSEIVVAGKRYKIEIRDTDEGRRQGLSGTSPDYLCSQCGMLFVWDEEGQRAMWMKDMNYPIDMYWLDSNMRVILVEHNVATSSYNSQDPKKSIIYGKGYNAKYVLETKVNK